MKKILCLSTLMCLPLTAYSAGAKQVHQLPAQTIDVSPTSHLTTRLQWSKFPQPNYSIEDLKNKNRAAIIRVVANTKGDVTDATVEESTGLKALDQILIQAVEDAQVKPHIKDGRAVSQIGYQAFNLKLSNADAICNYRFDSKVWLAQTEAKKTTFQYVAQPQLELDSSQLNGHNRQVKFSFTTDKHGNVKKVKIKQGSGVYALDQSIVHAVTDSQIRVKRTARTLWLYKKSSFKDEIQFKLNACQSS
jgi:TonB family protein